MALAEPVDRPEHRHRAPPALDPRRDQGVPRTVGRLAAEMGPEWHDELRDITSRAIPLATATPDTSPSSSCRSRLPAEHTRDALGANLSSLDPSPHRPITPPA